jgi:hypothetical protein
LIHVGISIGICIVRSAGAVICIGVVICIATGIGIRIIRGTCII